MIMNGAKIPTISFHMAYFCLKAKELVLYKLTPVQLVFDDLLAGRLCRQGRAGVVPSRSPRRPSPVASEPRRPQLPQLAAGQRRGPPASGDVGHDAVAVGRQVPEPKGLAVALERVA